MTPTPLTPVFVGLRAGLHGLFVVLTLLVVVRALVTSHESSVVISGLALLLLVTYAAGRLLEPHTAAGRAWLAVLVVEWVALLWLSAEAAYLVFPLFFLFLHLLGRVIGTVAIVGATATAIIALGVHNGWSVGGVVGPVVGAGVALLIGLGYQALAREAAEREALLRELVSTRDLLATTQHEAGVSAERSRLAREIHDTVAQGLSSIQILLHAAERADPDRAGIDQLRLARDTAAANLAETRRFIRELTPPDLDHRGLPGALRRLADTEWASHDLAVTV